MQPLGNKVLVMDIIEEEKKSEAGLILLNSLTSCRKVSVTAISEDIDDPKVKESEVCLCNHGGIEVDKGVWLCDYGLLIAIV